ncbi:hypothetical protein DN752_03855 [Echinicola strongylocentroti]|uniref:6-bladed beta-propeller n=1 Tax=Echinicola strongylocentroti TaxID=1795355 RepID=A0A2Z4IFG4_9BACT|nr:6-bladed beta-propeller [Echinicola strongylocentroti]AWW29346.1 hypothetical protein DN752_03855 [Echinicola strongylocentroti]
MKNIIYSVIFLFLLGCSEKKEKIDRYTEEQVSSLHLGETRVMHTVSDSLVRVDLNPILSNKVFDFQKLVKSIRLVPLETTEKSLIGPINKVLATESHIYIYDRFKGGGLVVFDNEGKFIRRIPNGQGPGELSRLYDIDFDEENDQLIAYEHSFLSFYKPDGKFIRQERLPFGFYNIVAIPKGYLIYELPVQGNDHMRGFEQYSFWVTDKNFKVNGVGLSSSSIKVRYLWQRYIYDNDEIIVTQRFNDTIYQYDQSSDQLKSKYILNYNENQLPLKYIKGSFEEFQKVVKENDYFFFIGEYLETADFQFFSIDNWFRKSKTVIYGDKRTGNMEGGTSGRFNIEEIPSLAPPQSTYKEEFISWYIPRKDFPFNTKSKMLSETDKAKVRDLTKEDNPVLVFFRLNDF